MLWFKPREERASIEDPTVKVSSPAFLSYFGMDEFRTSSSGVAVTTEAALGVPAIWDAVNFISGTLAGLPLRVYRKTSQGRQRVSGTLSNILHDAVNDEQSSFDWRKYTFEQVLTEGRAYTYIERSSSGLVQNLFPLDPSKMTVVRDSGQIRYQYNDGPRIVYDPRDVLDFPFMLKSDGLQHRSPIGSNKDIIGLAIAATNYGSKIFRKGGLPPAVMQGPFSTGEGAKRASDDVARAMSDANNDGRQVLTMPLGHELKMLGFNAEQMQLVDLQRFIVEQIARIYQIPPTFLQDLTHGTFSNTEQQDLHFVKHTLKRWVEQAEQQMNLKFFGRGSSRYVEFAVDGLLRGDFKTRMDGNAQAIQTGQLTPNEAREMDNRPSLPGGDDLMIQGATVPMNNRPDGVSNEP